MSLHIRVSILVVLVTFFCAGFFLVLVGVARQSVTYTPSLVVTNGIPDTLSAKAVYVFDVASGTPLYAKNKDQQLPIASVTKLLSTALFYQYATATASTTVTWTDVQTEGRAGRLQAGQEYLNSMFLFPALLESSNDATAVMQRVLHGTLVEKMNAYVADTQLTQTHFVDASGLADNNISTAYELSVLSTALYTEYPYIFDITRLKTYLNHINAWMNNNPFVRDQGYKGGKHGYTPAANRTAVAFFEEELDEGGNRLVGYVLLGSDTLQTDMEALRTFVQRHVQYK